MNYTPKIGHIFGYSSINRALTFLLNRGLTFLLHFCIHNISNTNTSKIYRSLLKIIVKNYHQLYKLSI